METEKAIEQGQDATFNEFVFWCAMPAQEKKALGLATVQEFAEHHGLSRTTLWRWKQRPDFKPILDRHTQQWAMQNRGAVMEGWLKACMKGDAKALELWLAYFEGWDKKSVIEMRQATISVDDIRYLINQLPDGLRDKYNQFLADLAADVAAVANAREAEVRSSADGPQAALPAQADHIPPDVPEPPTDEVAEEDTGDVREAVERGDHKSNRKSPKRRGKK